MNRVFKNLLRFEIEEIKKSQRGFIFLITTLKTIKTVTIVSNYDACKLFQIRTLTEKRHLASKRLHLQFQNSVTILLHH